MVAPKAFNVSVRKREYVVPMKQIVEQYLSLSNLDMILPPEDVGVFFCYKNPRPNLSFRQMVSTLRTSLAQVLVYFYVFSSEVVHNYLGEPEIKCDNQGVEFIEAYGDCELIDLEFYNPQSVEGKLLPKNQPRVFSVQVTRMKCGGVILGCSFDHRVADAYSANMFFVSWAELANSTPISLVPSSVKSLLHPRIPPSYDPSLNDMYIPISASTPNENEPRSDPLVSRIYKINAQEINNLQSLAKGTKLESLSAFLWQLLAKHTISILEHDQKTVNAKTCKMGIVVDGRTRLREGLMNCYFGNVLSIPFGEKSISELSLNPLDQVAQEVHECIDKATRKDHFQDLIDWIEVHRPQPCLSKIYSVGRDDGPAFVVSSGQRFPVSKVDFGWGKPVFGSYYFQWSGKAGYVMPMPSSSENGDWVVYMCFTKEQLEFIEKVASHVLKPFKLSL